MYAPSDFKSALLYDPQGSLANEIEDGTFEPAWYVFETADTWLTPTFYDAYGLKVWSEGTPQQQLDKAKQFWGVPFNYKGQFGYCTDDENICNTGLIYCQHRYYDPYSGRWTSRDPIGLEGGVNVYEYCDGNPVTGADPSGLDALIVWGPDKQVAIAPGKTLQWISGEGTKR